MLPRSQFWWRAELCCGATQNTTSTSFRAGFLNRTSGSTTSLKVWRARDPGGAQPIRWQEATSGGLVILAPCPGFWVLGSALTQIQTTQNKKCWSLLIILMISGLVSAAGCFSPSCQLCQANIFAIKKLKKKVKWSNLNLPVELTKDDF